MDSKQVPVELQIETIIQQLRSLSDEAIAILYEDGLLCSEYIDELAFRVQEHFTRESKTLKKICHHQLNCRLRFPAKRPKKIDLHWFNQHLIPKKVKTDHPHSSSRLIYLK